MRKITIISSDGPSVWQASTHPEDEGWYLMYDSEPSSFPLGVHLDAESVQFVVDLLNKDLQHEGVLSRFVYRFCGLEW